MSLDLDDIDRAVLRELARDARQPASALGRKLGLSQPAAWRRIKRLEDANVISGRRVRLDAVHSLAAGDYDVPDGDIRAPCDRAQKQPADNS